MAGRLENKVAVITGGSRGIGKAAVMRFAQEGAKVAIWDLIVESGQAVANEVRGMGVEAEFFEVNVAKFESVETATQAVKQKFGRIDILVNNAGITRDSSLLKMTPEQWQQVIDVNLTGVFNCTKCVAPIMTEQNYGRIINTSSVVGLQGNFGQGNYVATKAGLVGLTKTWARELGKKGITVNSVAPGFIATDMVLGGVPEKYLNALKERTPLGRLGTPEEIAAAYVFLASDDAAFITGTTLSVDGGISV